MALKVFGNDPENQPKPRQSFADDIVGRFRSGHQLNGRPASLDEWRVTTGDPEVASEIHDILGGDEPQKWDAQGEDDHEVFTASDEIEIILDGAKSLRERMILWGRNGKIISSGDGETLDNGDPDPDADLTFAERKQKGKDGIGPVPQIEIYFRLAANPELGIFKFQTGSWSMAYDLAANNTAEKLEEFEGAIAANLRLELVEFDIKKGKNAGTHVSYRKPVLTIKGAAE